MRGCIICLATCAAEASKPSKSIGASSEISPSSNPGRDASNKLEFRTVKKEVAL